MTMLLTIMTKNHDRLWKIRQKHIYLLNNAYSKYYTLSEHLAVDEVTVLFKAFKQYIPKTQKRFGIKNL
jgi:hypothetical protein